MVLYLLHCVSEFSSLLNGMLEKLFAVMLILVDSFVVAPPPKANTQRRSGPQQPMVNNGKIMDSQDLFGSTPFHSAPISFEVSLNVYL